MYRAIAIDDEKRALDRLERVLTEEPRIEVVGKFTSADEAAAFAARNAADIAFLDIEIPGVNGLALAEKLVSCLPGLEIVFVTAYDNYALQAFHLHAAGYLLKPVDADGVREQIDVLDRRRRKADAAAPRTLRVRCFGQFHCHAGEETAPIRWRTVKAEEMFALFVHYRGAPVSREIVIDTLWPEAEPQKAPNLFRVTCTYLRNALAERGFENMLSRERDSYRVDMSRLKCDAAAFITGMNAALKSDDIQRLERTAALYAGPYLATKPYEWAAKARTAMENGYKQLQYRLAELYTGRAQPDKAADALQRVLAQDPCEEDAIARLIELKLGEGDAVSAARIYRRYESELRAAFDLQPSEKLKARMSGYL